MAEFTVDELKCTECPLHETSSSGTVRRSGVYGRGSGRSGLWFYGEALGEREVSLGLPFVGQSGELLTALLREVGIDEEECWICNSIRCRPPGNRIPKASEIKKCMEIHALKDVPKYPPKLIVTLGNVPLKAVLDLQKITENRGKLFDSELFNCQVLPTFHPSAILRDPRKYDTLKGDLIKARDIIKNNSIAPPKIHRELINSKGSFLRWMNLLTNPEIKDRFCDIETTGLEYFRDTIASISFCTEMDGDYYGIAFLTMPKDNWWYADLDDPEIRVELQKVLSLPTDFQDGIFDIKFFWRKGFRVNYGTDILDQHVLIDENSPHNLRYLISMYNHGNTLENKEKFADLDEYTEGEFYKSPPELLLDINIDDTYNGLMLKKKFTPLLKEERMDGFFKKLQMPLKRVLTRMSYRGIKMDREGIIRLSDSYREKIKQKEIELFDQAKQVFKYASSSKELPRVLFKDLQLPVLRTSEKTGEPSTDKEVLSELAELHPVPTLITELRYYKGMLQKYLDGNDLSENPKPGLGMLCCLDEHDRIHGRFLSFGTVSGRPSCSKPNLLNIPKNPEIRGLFIAPEGWKFIEIDDSQAEMVLLAYLSQDEQFMHDVMHGNFHLNTAKSLMKAEEVTDEIKRKAKGINFLKSYGGGAEKLAKKLKRQEEELYFAANGKPGEKLWRECKNPSSWYHYKKFPVPVNFQTINPLKDVCYVCEAEEWLKKWDETYPKVPVFKDQQKILWKTQGYIEGIYGRKKRFPPALTKQVESKYDRISYNFMCQNGGSGDNINSALVDIDDLFGKLFGWSPDVNHLYSIPGIVLAVYDSILVEAPDNIVEDIKDAMLEIMTIPLPKLNISLKTEVVISQRWGEKLEKVADPVELEDEMEMG